jgi:hypothetical protein
MVIGFMHMFTIEIELKKELMTCCFPADVDFGIGSKLYVIGSVGVGNRTDDKW